ncbi:MAG TPA: lamin tail domain-containing protein [Lacipirellulaceae bacterium]|jgi:hypothetical protein|nr:lamin tail domain-containing protein [Lacipirellulaceae bacterium]
MRLLIFCAAICAILLSRQTACAAIIINEVVYDDGGTDDREFVELYNNGASAVDISGWVVRNSDTVAAPGDNNADLTIPATTSLAAGDYYVIGMTGVANVDLVVTGTLENDNEGMELLDASGAIQDRLVTELNKGPVAISPAEGGFFGNTTTTDPTVTPLNTRLSLGRFVDGRDTNSNGRDFGMRPSTPGTANNTGFMTFYQTPNPTGQTVGAEVPGFAYNFVNAKYIDPTVADGTNPNAIAPAPSTGNRAIIAWDPSGGGNAVTTTQVFNTAQSGFRIFAYLETSDLPQQQTATAAFQGSEVTIYGIGSGDFNGTGLADLTDLAGNVGLSAVALPASDNFNGTTGFAWVYERTAINGTTPAKEFLYLVDANDGGDSQAGGNTPLDWTILQTIDLSNLASNWYELSINVDALGNGVARFNGTNYLFTAPAAFHSGAFNVSYRENLQLGADGTPDAIMRPATFTIIPEPGTMMLLAAGLLAVAIRRR